MPWCVDAEGRAEHEAVSHFVDSLAAEDWAMLRWTVPNRLTAPELFVLMRRR